MALQEIGNMIKILSDNISLIFSREHFIGADAILGLNWGDYNKPWVFTDEGVDDAILMKEKLEAEQNIRLVPDERVKNFNLGRF